MSRNFSHLFLALALLFTASAAPSLSHATSAQVKAVQALHEGPGGSGNGGDPNPCDDEGCVVRAL